MYSSFVGHLECPVLAVDLAADLVADPGETAMRGLLYAPPAAPGDEPSLHAFALARAETGNGFDPGPWRALLAGAGLPWPEIVLASALEDGADTSLPGAAGVGSRSGVCGRLWNLSRSGGASAGQGGIGVASLMAEPAGEDMLRLCAIQRITGYPALDSSAAFLLGLLAEPAVSGRSRREGVTLLFAGRHTVRAGLVFQDRVLGFFELPAERVLPADGSEPSVLLHCLEDFRLGWLPKERAAELGGFAAVVPALPGEAEGFRPLFVTGPCADRLEGRGRIVGDSEHRAVNNCRGLLYGYARLLEERAASAVPGR